MKKIIAIALALVMCLGIMSMVAFAETNTYYLIGYLNGADYGFNADSDNMGQYKFVNGKLSATFNQDSYVFLKTEGNGAWFMTDTYVDGTTGTFKNTEGGSAEKMKVPGNVQVNFTLTENADGTLTLSYTTGNSGSESTTTATQATTTATQATTAAPTTAAPTTAKPVTSGTRTLTVKVPSSWKEVHVYTWEPNDLGDWPGSKLTKASDGSYKTNIKNSMVNLVVASEKQADTTYKQTGNIALETNGKAVTVTVNEDCSYKVEYAGGGSSSNGGTRKPAAADPVGTPSNYRVVGNAEWMGSWKEDNDKGIMIDIGGGVYRKNFDNVAPGSYELKITKDGKWDNAIGDENGQNFKFTVDQKCKITVDFTMKDGKGVISVYGSGVPALGDVSMISVVILMALASVTAIVLVVNKKKFI